VQKYSPRVFPASETFALTHHLPRQTNPNPRGPISPRSPRTSRIVISQTFKRAQKLQFSTPHLATTTNNLVWGWGSSMNPNSSPLSPQKLKWCNAHFAVPSPRRVRNGTVIIFVFGLIFFFDTRVGVVLNGAGVFSKGVSCL
jgi:hypothetical protein